jgi:hemoglobin/transferrin/lactoferrin receptor protein
MVPRRAVLPLLMTALCATAAWAQQPLPPSPPQPGEQAPDAPPGGEPPLVGRGVVTPEPMPGQAALPLQRDSVYPGLGNQPLGSLSGGLRSEMSLLEAPLLATVIDRQLLDEKAPSDMFQALQFEVGVLVQRTARGQASPFVRGLTGQQVLMLVDGVRLNNGTFRAGANQYFNLIDPGQVERIEVLRGPQSVIWGSDALGGVINVVTRGADATSGPYAQTQFVQYYTTADQGSYSRWNVEGWTGSTGVFAGASYLNVRDLDRGGDLGRQPFTNYDQYAADVKIDRLLDPITALTVALQHFEQRDVPRSDRFFPFVPLAQQRPTFFDPQQRNLAYLRLEGLSLNDMIDAYSFTASYTRSKEGAREIRGGNRDEGEFDVHSAGLNLVASTDLDWAGTLTYGADWYHDDVDAFRNRFDDASGTLIGPRIPQFPDDSSYERLGVFLQWHVDLTERWSMLAAVRYELVELAGTPTLQVNGQDVPRYVARSFDDWIGSLGLNYRLADGWHLVGSISEGFRAPNLDDLVATNPFVQQSGLDLPSIDLNPEHAITYEIGLKIDTPRLRSQAFVFWTDLQDNILRTPVAQAVFQRSNRDSYIQGVEWYGEYLLGGGWSPYANFAYTFGRDRILDQPLSRIPPTQGVLGLRWRDVRHRHWIDLYAWLVRRQDRVNFQDVTDARVGPDGTPAFQTLNLRLGTTLGRGGNHRLIINLENLFDQAYRVHGSGVDGPGFNATLGYDVVF